MNSRDVAMCKQMERELYLAKERAEITLASIGDAVIVTDDQERILFLNHVAITLTGWALEEAVGQNIQTVFHIVHEETRLMLPSPVAQVLCHKKTVLLSNHAVLVARDGMEYFIEDSAAPIFNKDGSLYGCVLVFHDVTDKHQLINAVNWQANHDVLTRLPNRTLLNDRFKRSLARAQRDKTLLAVCVLDLDDFKPVNDRYGHYVGDLTLIQVAQRLERLVRSDDTVARLGGDEFVLLLNNVRDNQELETIVLRVLEQVSMPYTIEGSVLHISASVGVTLYPLDNVDADTLIRHADQAMYLAKQRGRNQYLVFDVTQDRHLQSTHQIANQVRTALKSDHLTLYYQPKVNLRTGEIMGMEALLRWIDPERGIIPPLDFLPQIEHSDLIVDIGEWVIDRTLRQLREWNNAGKSWVVSVNIAAYHFQKPEFLDRLKHLLARYPQVAPESLEIEILESVALGDIHHAKQLITDCQALGIQFSLDDFGTGYSSLGYLRRLPANTIKIDQSFVRDILDDRDDLALVEAVISMGKVLNRKVIAEGVETSEHGVLLIRLGCDLAQGYGIARPMPADQVLAWADTFVADPVWSTWANVAWEIKDFPLLVAQQDHLQWVRRLILWVENYHAAFNEHEVADSHACRFGRWYDGEGRQRYGQLAEFLAIAPTHEALHQLGLDIVQYCQSGERQRAIDACAHLLTLKDEIIGYLSVLQKAVVQATSE